MTDRTELLRLAESVEAAYHYSDPEDHQQCDDLRESATILRKLAEQEPMAFICHGHPYLWPSQDDDCGSVEDHISLYAAPVPKE